MGGFSNFAISFSIISILTGAVTLFGYGLEMGGPLEMTLGWPLATLFTLTVAASMAELCSAYPTAGAMYHWAADLGGPGWGWFVAWLNIFGLIAAQAGINYSCAQFILPFLGVASTPRNSAADVRVHSGHAGAAEPLRREAGGDPERFQRDRAHRRCRGSGRRAVLSGAKAAGQLFVRGRQQQWPFALLVGLRAGTSCKRSGPTPVSMPPLTWPRRRKIPRRHAPWGIVLSVAVSGVVGYLLLIASDARHPRHSGRAGRQGRRRQPHPRGDRDSGDRAGSQGGQCHVGAGIDGHVVLRTRHASRRHRARSISLARDEGTPLRAPFAIGKQDARHAGPGHLVDRSGLHRRHGLDRSRSRRHVAQHSGAVSGLHHSRCPGPARAPRWFGLAQSRGLESWTILARRST